MWLVMLVLGLCLGWLAGGRWHSVAAAHWLAVERWWRAHYGR